MKLDLPDGNKGMSKGQADKLPVTYIDFLYHSNGYTIPTSARAF